MIDLILPHIPPDADRLLYDFIAEQEAKYQGKIFVRLAYQSQPNSKKEHVCITVYLRTNEGTSPMLGLNTVPVGELISQMKKNMDAQWAMLLGLVPIQKLLDKAFRNLEAKKQSKVAILIQNEGENTVFELLLKNSQPEKNFFKDFLAMVLNNSDEINNEINKLST